MAAEEPSLWLSFLTPERDEDEGLEYKVTSSKITTQQRYMPSTAAMVMGKVSRKDQASHSVQ